ncbi:MAG: dimethylsulfonioproprionate lyase family protein [Thermomicrobiales bacterium]
MGFAHPRVGKPAPVRKVTRLAEERSHPVAEVTGHPRDEGVDCELIGRHVNGATEFAMGVYCMSPNQLHPRHYHPRGAELYYVLDGSCLITVDDDEIEATPGTAVYLPEGTIHAVRTRPTESVSILWSFDEGDERDITTTWLE